MQSELPPMMSIAFLHPVVDDLLRRGTGQDALARQLGVKETELFDASVLVPANSVYAFLAWATTTAGERLLCARMGERMATGGWAPILPLLSSCASVGEFFQKFSLMASEQGRAVSYRLEVEGHTAIWRLIRASGASKDAAYADAVAVGFFIGILKRAAGVFWAPDDVTLVLPDETLVPSDLIAATSVLAGEQGMVIRFPSTHISLPMPKVASQPDLPNLRVSPAQDTSLANQVTKLIESRISDPDLKIDDIAGRLGFPTWKLQTLLKQTGLSFVAMRNEVRRNIALLKVSSTDEPIAKIAEKLGYKDSSTFSRAYKTWTGETPRDRRRRN